MSNTIVVGSDGSPASKAAADWAARRAHRYCSDMRLVFTVPDATDPGLASRSRAGFEAAAHTLDEERARLAALFPGLTIHTTIKHGEPVAVLGGLSHEAGMVVVGSDKPADAHGEGFGAVGPQLVIRSACTVAIIPVLETARTGVVVGVDGSPEADLALQVASGEAEMSGQALTVVHALTHTGPGTPGKPRDGQVMPGALEAGEEVLAAAVAAIAARHPRLEVHRVLDTRHTPAQALASAAGGSGLLVVGSRGRKSVRHMRPGAIGSVVLARIGCPLLVTTGPGTSGNA
ncbi:universal stress protein [Arthrobacter sp. SDTb3-6]|uniref:universal stress protein n=1 Tax=Arthrobacter sp. SDTb3-6 TaxID=2713571 RepID=UPI00159DA3DB|nr:universal stress protein [Arthrobacter sp. SDTb3-6]NVM99814.1 universal stress protein [Arthrobacter sp. SDTb3-6]